ncbi:MAG: zinc-dependent metalloprotease [Chitinophagaceae bacterium]|nr:zinc-dependent metalloprotease [Chitinophagaceae bacterium]
MHQFFNHRWLVAVAVCACSVAAAQTRPDTARIPGAMPGAGGARPSAGPKPYKEVITAKAVSDAGLFTVHKVEDKYYFEIGDSVLGRDILVVNRLTKAAAGMRSGFFGFAGDQIGQSVIRFEKGPNNKVFLRNISFAEYTKDSTSPMFTAVNNSNVQPIAAAFDVRAFSKDSSGQVIDITDYISGDNDVLFFSGSLKSSMRIGGQQADKSYIKGVRSFPSNVEISTVKTYSRMASLPGQGGGGGFTPPTPGGNITVELNSSFVLLPKEPMQARYFDPRVGYFAVGYTDFDSNPQGVEAIRLIKRWRLEPKDADIEKYKRGELVEPKKPIIFYIDPATPKKWIPYLIQGVNDWQVAFEKAGFKNAVLSKLAPTKQEDPEWSLEDARYSAIVYKPSDVANASGPSISDPRSGEIMESHINWYHNVMKLIRDWYFVQCSPLDPGARKLEFDDELMGQLIRFVSSHEVGHTLGLRHNYGSSSTVPVEKLRDKAWVEANGHTPSIMDYARFNYVAQPEDKISRAGLFPRIGDYDKWAIEWGYKLFPQFKDGAAEQSYLNKWVIEALKNNRLWFGTETNPDDPRSQREQVGDDGMKGAYYGIKNLQRIIPNLVEWTKEENKGYNETADMYRQVTGQFTMYMSHVAKYIGGIMETPKTQEQGGAIYEVVAKAKQKEAVEFLNGQLFNTPAWLIDQNIFGKTGISATATIGRLQDNVLNGLLSTRTLGKLIEAEAAQGTNAYSILDLFGDLRKGIWGELATRSKISVYRRNLQKSYISALTGLISNARSGGSDVILVILGGSGSASNPDKSDIKSAVKGHLASLRTEIKAAAGVTTDTMTRYHLQDIVARIDMALDPKE